MKGFIEDVVGVIFILIFFTILFSGLLEQFILGVIESF